MVQRAPFIVLEGPEGAGKTVQSTRLADWLRRRGWQVIQTREPGGTPTGDAIRAILLQSEGLHLQSRTEALLMTAARAQHVAEVILPALAEGTAVVCDRFVDSTYAYQGGGSQLPMDELERLQEFATRGLVPDIRLLLDLPVEVGLTRRHGDSDQINRIDLAPLEFHMRVRQTFRNLASSEPDLWDIIDASKGIDEVTTAIIEAVARRLQGWSIPDPHRDEAPK